MNVANFDCRMYWIKNVVLLQSVSSRFCPTFWTPKLRAVTSTSQLYGMLRRSTKEMHIGKAQENMMSIYYAIEMAVHTVLDVLKCLVQNCCAYSTPSC